LFYPRGRTKNVDSLDEKTDVSGWQRYSGQVDKEMRDNGVGKNWESGTIYIGRFANNRREEGLSYELQPDKSHTLFQVKYNEDGDEIERQELSKGH
jgi:hypothetical protein